ncbi:hypothetical protein [Streptomyces sp. SPB4]|uniref:hypothetical protein n=1 Tax=Streptomyces sp. SPB4 TaxID=2940553 RepID=UPI002474DF6C|nr:hypothetical protein [Streptomyces sp. SPB4]MDH6538682.1 hypothetical protein [Streptomyces sp. SPB4]
MNAIGASLTPYSFPPTPPAVKVRSRHDANLPRDMIRHVIEMDDHAPELHPLMNVEQLTTTERLRGIGSKANWGSPGPGKT